MPEMRQLNDGTWLDEETGVVIAPEAMAFGAGPNQVYTGPPLMPRDMSNPAPPLPFQRSGMLPSGESAMAHAYRMGPKPLPNPQLAVSPFALGAVTEGVKKVLLVAGIVGITWVTVAIKNRINGKKKKNK